MKYRSLGARNLRVSEIGFGAWGIGGRTPGATSYGETDDQISKTALWRAFELGVSFFDTSNVYGLGKSETLIGEVFSRHRDQIVIATKAGFIDYAKDPDFTPSQISGSLDQSLARLKTDHVDLFQLHNPSPAWLREHPETLRALDNVRKSGKALAIGVSAASPADGVELLHIYPFDSVQVNLNMLDLRALDCGLLDVAASRGCGIIARTPLCFGFLTGRMTGEESFPAEDHRSRWPREQIRRWADGARRALLAASKAPDMSGEITALRFCLSLEGVVTVIPGMLTPEEVEKNVPAADHGPLPVSTMERIRKNYREMDFTR